MNLIPYREAILRACEAGTKTRAELREICNVRPGTLATQQFGGLIHTMVAKGLIVVAGQIPNPNKGQGPGKSNTPFVNLYRAAADPRKALTDLVQTQAGDDDLWFCAATCSEAYLQQELRKLHAAVEAWIGQ